MISKSCQAKTLALSLSAGATLIVLWKTWKYFRQQETSDIKVPKSGSLYIKSKQVVIVTTNHEWNEIYPQLKAGLLKLKVLGLDCEWVVKNKVALLQLCTVNGLCVLVRLNIMKHPLPETLEALLADKSILKTGVAVLNDGKKLHQDHGLAVNGCVDLRHLVERVRSVHNYSSKGLKGLSREILDVDINKNPSIRCGDWEAANFSQDQIDYAATDAAVGVDIFLRLVSVKMGTEQCSRLAADCGDGDSIAIDENFWNVGRSMCQGVVDVPYNTSSSASSDNKNQTSARNPNKKVKDDNKIYSTRKRPLWDNCRLQAPDGSVLCTCDRRKAQWYLDKELADLVCEDPVTVRLRFEPSNRPENERNYYLQEKENQCVVCSCDKDYVRKFVIPFEYKKFFPSALKDHSSHDVLLLCTSCHRRSCDYDAVLRQQLAIECDAPIDSGSFSKTIVDQDLQKVRSAGRALKLNKGSIPEKRVEQLETLLKDYFHVDHLSDDIIESAAEFDVRQMSEDYVPHGKKVVRHMVMNGGLLAFQARWRKHFLDSMRPQFLPAFWSVDYVPEGWNQSQSS